MLLDACVDVRLAACLVGHEVDTAGAVGMAHLSNGLLISAAEAAGYDVLLTVDKGMRHQQSVTGRKLSLVTMAPVLVTLKHLEPLLPELLDLLEHIEPGMNESISEPAQ